MAIANTDNKGKLLVTLFAGAFCLRMGTGKWAVSGPLHCSQLKFVKGTDSGFD